MRPSVLLSGATLLALTGCYRSQLYVDGTVGYESTPPIAGESGALPLRVTYCGSNRGVFWQSVRLGEHCLLLQRGFDRPAITVGECLLPMAKGEVPFTVKSTSIRREDVVLGGTTSDGHYVTYRFSGGETADAPDEACTSPFAPVRTSEKPSESSD